ncbi:hypothetical protein LptCag_1533 [Leptospirillum ferriphilum]|uniref:Uncharacterized protein n=1 Tax=Leptospirillum ferriphilum TaxID=178606 RepID=A0A094W8G1_9BACT|nr:hypothetical protein LptCag_1533 [Leptospirillum ferriphilum]
MLKWLFAPLEHGNESCKKTCGKNTYIHCHCFLDIQDVHTEVLKDIRRSRD